MTLSLKAAQGNANSQRTAAEAQRRSVAEMAPSVERQLLSIAPQKTVLARVGNLSSALAPCERLNKQRFGEIAAAAAQSEGIEERLLHAVARQESAFDPCAVSPKGALGVMQLMPATADDLGVTDPFDAVDNISAGARLLRLLLDRYKGDLEVALAAYNAGPARVDAFGGVPPIPETIDYVRRIKQFLGTDLRRAGAFR